MDRDRLATRFLLPLLLAALAAAAGYVAFGTVETLEFGRSAEPLPRAPRAAAPAVGERFDSLAALDAALEDAGFVRVGRFGDAWPARVAEIREERDALRFVRGDGTPHSYRGFEGYALRMVRLRRGADESIAVYRSAQRR